MFRNSWCVRTDKEERELSQCEQREGGQFPLFCAGVFYGRLLINDYQLLLHLYTLTFWKAENFLLTVLKIVS